MLSSHQVARPIHPFSPKGFVSISSFNSILYHYLECLIPLQRQKAGFQQKRGNILLLAGASRNYFCFSNARDWFWRAFWWGRTLCFLSMFRLGAMCGAIVTSPFDVVKTRLQSDLFKVKPASVTLAGNGSLVIPHRPNNLLYHFVETGHILRWVLLRWSVTMTSPYLSTSLRQWYLSRRIATSPIQRSRSNTCRLHSRKINKLLRIWQWQANHCQPVQ